MSNDKSALLVIDALESLGSDSVYEPNSADALYRAAISKVVDGCHKANIPVIFANDAHMRGIDQEIELWGEHGMKGETRIFPEINQLESDFIVEKRRYSAFFQTDMELLLKELGVGHLYCVGGDTNICVLHTLADAFFLNYKTTLITEATITFLGVGTQEIAFEHCEKCYGTKLMTSEEFLSSLA